MLSEEIGSRAETADRAENKGIYIDISPVGAAAVVACSREKAGEYMRRLRRQGIKSAFVRATESEDEAKKIVLEDDVRFVIALGGETEANCAKFIAAERQLPVFAVLTSAAAITVYDGVSHMKCGNVISALPALSPQSVRMASDLMTGDELPAAFGGICAAALSVFDCEAYARATGRSADVKLREQVTELVYGALDAARAYDRHSPELSEKLCGISSEISRLAFAAGESRIMRGACDDCARLAAMLLGYERRKIMRRGELAYIFGSVLVGMYRDLLLPPKSFVPPPDNNRRAELIAEYLGIDQFTAARMAAVGMGNTRLISYRLAEYREELAATLDDAVKIFDESKKYFRRLFPDDGYCLVNYLDAADIRTVVALASDVCYSHTSALSLMRDLGYLERYL